MNLEQQLELGLHNASEQAAHIADQALTAIGNETAELRAHRIVEGSILLNTALPRIQELAETGTATVSDVGQLLAETCRLYLGRVDIPTVYLALGLAFAHPRGIDAADNGTVTPARLLTQD